MRRDSMSWNSIYMTPKGYPAPPDFAEGANKADGDTQPANVKEAEDMQFAEAMEQVRLHAEFSLNSYIDLQL